MDDEVKFFTEGLGMRVVRQREVNGARNVFVSYGEESLKVKDGGEQKLSESLHAAVVELSERQLCFFQRFVKHLE